MKIGIITYHCADNYGAVLQCYALQEVIKRMGHDVKIIDYRNPVVLNDYVVKFNLPSMLLYALTFKFNYFLKYIPSYCLRKKRQEKFENFRRQYLNRTKQVGRDEIAQDFDRIIIGSDQMWTIACCKKYEPVYFGDFVRPKSCKLYGYAISSKGDFFMPLSASDLKRVTGNFENISFRESRISELVKLVTGHEYPVCIDPTLLTNSTIWDSIINKDWASQKYVVTYQARWPAAPNFNAIDNIAKEYAQRHNYKVISLNSRGRSIEDFVSIIKYAKAVFTSSFHATVFSIIFNTPFKSFCLHDGNDDRYLNLLRLLDLEKNIVESFDKVEFVESFDEQKVAEKLTLLQKDSLEYLNTIFI